MNFIHRDYLHTKITYTQELNEVQRHQLSHLIQSYHSERRSLPVSSVSTYEASLENTGDGVGLQYHLAYHGFEAEKKIIGYGILEYRTNPINDLSFSTLQLYVQPEYRRRRVATSIMKSIHDHLPEQIEKIQFSLDYTSYLNTKLQETYRVVAKHQTILNVSEISTFKLHQVKQQISIELEKLREKISDIEFIRIKNDDYPMESIQFAKLMETIWNGIPGEDDERQYEKFPVERVEARYEWFRNQQADFFAILARDNSCDKYIGFTELMIRYDNPIVAEQSLTGVDPEYRGKNLGYVLKLQMLQYLLGETKTKYWVTANASENPAIGNINKKLGYMIHKIFDIYTLEKAQLDEVLKEVMKLSD